MEADQQSKFDERITRAAEFVLQRDGSVGPLELFQELRFLQPVHVEAWRKGNEHFRILEKWIQLGPEKYARALKRFETWVRQLGLRPTQAAYVRRTPSGVEPLQVTADGDPEREKFFRTHYVAADLPEKKVARVAAKLNKAPDLVVFDKVGDTAVCSECGTAIEPGDRLTMEKSQPLCLTCADLDHLVFLPAGDTALSRRSRKYSPLSAVVVRFNRTRKRYERQGLLVTSAAIARAESECAADAPERAAARARAVQTRAAEDREFVAAMTAAIRDSFPGCPPEEAQRIAAHAATRGSGRVGRSAAGRSLAAHALELAVRAHIRHEHTNYDQLLMRGDERSDARGAVASEIERICTTWRHGPVAG